MTETLAIVASIFGLIGFGYAAGRLGLLPAAVGEGLLEFVFKVAIPLLLFRTLAEADLHGLAPWRVWAAYFIPFALTWALADLVVRRGFGRDARSGVVAGGSAAFSNSVLFAIPLIQAAFGAPGTVYLIAVISVHLAVLTLASLALNERALRADRVAADPTLQPPGPLQVVARLARHPILIGILAGALWRLTGLPIPAVAALIIGPLADSAGPLALFASGMALLSYGIARQIPPALAIAAMKLLLMPALVLVAAWLCGLPPIGVAALTLTAAGPTGVNVLLLASQLGTGQALASNSVLFSTAGSVVTVTLWLIALRTMLG